MPRFHIAARAFGAALASGWSALATAGDLNPPGGPVTATMKPLSQVEPRTPLSAATTPGDANSIFKITQPGSYYLTGNLTGVAGFHGIEVAASGVTIDLMGFDMVGAAGTLDAINTAGALTSVAVRNGSVRSFAGEGIDLGAVSQALVTGVRVASCNGHGIVAGINAVITGCALLNNGSHGVFSGAGALIDGCAVSGSGLNGIECGANAMVTRCTVRTSANHGITVGNDSTVIGCASSGNSATGITTLVGSSIADSLADSNTVGGINAGNGAAIKNCTARNNTGYGITVGDSAAVTGTAATANFANGLSGGSGCTIAHCTVSNNSNHGLVLVDRCSVTDNTASSNGNDGIRFGSGCTVRGNTCTLDGITQDSASVHALGSDNVIEGNNCTLADRGIDVDGVGNLIIRNWCSGAIVNNYDIVASNRYGPIVNITAGGAGAATGNSAISSLTATDPWANFAY